MNKTVWIFSFSFILFAGYVRADDTDEHVIYSCEYEAKDRGTSGSASLEVKNGIIQKVSFDNFFRGLPGNIGYRCMLEATRGDKETKWEDVGLTIEVGFPDAEEWGDGDSVLIKPNAAGFLIDFSRTKSSGKCGAGAEFPEQITILKTKKKCKVRL